MVTEFYSFGDALKKLQLEKEELEQLIHEGEVKAYPTTTGTLQFKRSDIDSIRLEKMSLPTIAVTEHSNNTEELFEQHNAPEELFEQHNAPEELFEQHNAPEELFEQHNEQKNEQKNEKKQEHNPPFKKNSTMFIQRLETELDDMNPLLDMTTSNPSISTVDNNMMLEKESKTTSDDFFFTQMERDEFLETGELLFDVKDEKLPGDREAEELFPESRIEYINEFDSSNITEPLKNAINLNDEEDGEEDILATSSHRYITMPERYSKKHQKQNKILIYSMSICASILLILIILLGFLKFVRHSTAVSIYTVQMQRIELIQQTSTTVEKLTIPIVAPKNGRLNWKININKLTEQVKKDSLIAGICPKEEVQKLEKLQEEQKTIEKQLKRANKEYSEVKKKKDTFTKNSTEYKKVIPEYNKKVIAKNNLSKQFKKISEEIDTLKYKITITANNTGFLIDAIPDNSDVQENENICSIQDGNNQFQAFFYIDLDKEISYKKNDTLSIKYEDKIIEGVILSIEKQEISTQLVVNLNDPYLENKALVESDLHYNKDALAIPTTAIQESQGKHFIYILDAYHRVHRQNIEIIDKNEKFAIINNIKAGEQIIAEQVSLQENTLVHEKK